jgi:hypothetical protein
MAAAGAPAAQVKGSQIAANAPLTISTAKFRSGLCIRDASGLLLRARRMATDGSTAST